MSEVTNAADQRYLLAARHAPIGIAIVSTEGVFLDSNERLCRLLGYDREELVGKTFHEVTHPDDLAVDVAHVEELLAGHAETYRIEKRYFTKDGRVRLSVSTVVPDVERAEGKSAEVYSAWLDSGRP